MFYLESDAYLYDPKHAVPDPLGQSAYLPIEIDTEYQQTKNDLNNPSEQICINITVQCRSIATTKGITYAHPDIAPIARHPVFKNPCPVVDYLQDNGYEVKLSRLSSWATMTDLPRLQLDLISYFAVSEYLRVFTGALRDDIEQLAVRPPKGQGIDQGRRLRTYSESHGKYQNWVELPWLIEINGYAYRLNLCWFDTCALGFQSYKKFCENTGVTLEYKDNFTIQEKGAMLTMYTDRAEDFDNYALGDLYNHDALVGYAERFKTVYDSLDLTEYYSPPRLTIGSTVAKLFESKIKKLFNASPDNRSAINTFCKYGSADYIKHIKYTTACLNAKVDGGRCRNNRPLDTVAKGALCDIDISGCYGEGQRVQTYPLGIPLIIDYPINNKNNCYESLRQFRKRYEKELVPGLWQARVSTLEGYQLKYPQDFLISWIPPKDISKMVTDSEFADTDEWWTVDNVGEIKIFNNQIKHAIITHDFIQWLDNVASPRQRKELMDNLYVETAMYYPARDRVNSVDELIAEHQKHSGKNLTFGGVAKGRTRKVSIEENCHKWYGLNMGDLLITRLIIERKKHPAKSPLNTLYKLCINTLYGDMVSPFFTVGNVVVGNNITARARALAWCMEKGLHGWQTITDGCVFDLNRIVYPRDEVRLTGEYLVGVYSKFDSGHHIVGGLDNKLSVTLNSEVCLEGNKPNYKGSEIALYDDVRQLTYKDAIQWANVAAMEHLQRLFPNLDILHQTTLRVNGTKRLGQFEFEVKGFFDTGIFHGSANYSLGINGSYQSKMRSYSNKEHKEIVLADDLQVISSDFKPSETFLSALQTPNKVERGNVYIKEKILKIGDYRRNYEKWQMSQAYPGCTVESAALLKEFSLSQFTFQTLDQYRSWHREYLRLLRSYGQSYEMFFLNSDNTLNYQAMIEAVDKAINEGKMNFFDGIDKRQANLYRQYMKHAQTECLIKMQQQLGKRYYAGLYYVEEDSTTELDEQPID